MRKSQLIYNNNIYTYRIYIYYILYICLYLFAAAAARCNHPGQGQLRSDVPIRVKSNERNQLYNQCKRNWQKRLHTNMRAAQAHVLMYIREILKGTKKYIFLKFLRVRKLQVQFFLGTSWPVMINEFSENIIHSKLWGYVTKAKITKVQNL